MNKRKYPFAKNRRGSQYDWIAWTEHNIKHSKKKNEGDEIKLSKKDFVSKWMNETGNISILDEDGGNDIKSDKNDTERN